MSGLKIAVLYGIRPHQLGFCGPQNKSVGRILLKYLSRQKVSERKIREILKGFKAAYPYYKLIAKSNEIKNPFNKKVVKAYWIGNELLENVSFEALKQMIAKEFFQLYLLKDKPGKKIKEIPFGSKPHHSFHVLVLGSISKKVILRGKLLDFCRIGWGEITKLNLLHNRVKVKYQPLLINKNHQLGKQKERYINWNKDWGPKIKIGDNISFHWKQAIQVLNNKETENLKKYTQKTLDAINIAL